MHAGLSISIRTRDSVAKASSAWSHRSSFIVGEMKMIDLDLRSAMEKRLRKAKLSDPSSSALFGGPSLAALMGDFYQFAPGTARALWDTPLVEDKIIETLMEELHVCFDSN